MISFIVPAHDEARLIGGTIDALHAAARTLRVDYEIVLVDDASTDETAQIAELRGARVVRVAHRHIAAARNAGAGVARGDVLVFVDADTRVDAPVVVAALDALRAGAAGGGASVRLHGQLTRYERWAGAFFVWLLRLARIAPGCFVFCTRSTFDAAGGFDERYYAAEDVAISRALARQGRFVILREPVWTSDRKLRTFTFVEHLRLVLLVALHGRRVLRSREHLALWYDKRRHGPP
ncbi:MAG: glycosyltransferase [Gammaproteobacteria bacterium]|nr:glycosyltransferase [Gammaproteobacteria bacterium]